MPRRIINKLTKSEHIRKYLRNTSWLIFDYGIRMVATTLVGIYVTRYLGPANFGMLNYSAGLALLFMPLASLGINSIIVRELVVTPEKRDILLGSAFGLKLICACIALILLYFTLEFTGDDPVTRLMVMIIGAGFLFQTANIIDPYFQSIVRSRNVVYAQQASLLISIAIKVLLVYFKQPLLYFAIASMLEIALFSIGLVIVYRANGLPIFEWKWHSPTVVKLLRQSFPLLLSGIFVTAYLRIDQIMITKMIENGDVANGNYSASGKLSEAFYGVSVILAGSLFPAVVNGLKISTEEFRKRLQQLYDLFTWLAISVSIVVAFLSDEIILFLYKEQYADAGDVLAVQIFASVLVFQGVASSNALVAESKLKYLTINTAAGCAINVVLNFYFIPHFGIVGAAVATLISFAVSNYLILFLFNETRENFYLITRSYNLFRILGNVKGKIGRMKKEHRDNTL